MPVTTRNRRKAEALREQAERSRLEVAATAVLSRDMQTVRRKVLGSYASSRPEIMAAIADALEPVIQGLADLAEQAQLQGRLRVQTLAQRWAQSVGRRLTFGIAGVAGTMAFAAPTATAPPSTYTPMIKTMLGSLPAQMGQAVMAAGDRAVQQGLTAAQAKAQLSADLKQLGFTAEATNQHLLGTWIETITQVAYAVGREQMARDPAVWGILWGWEYTTVGDDRVRPEHAGYDGMTLPKDDPRWEWLSPPNGWRCRCAKIEVFDEPDEVREPRTVSVDGKDVTPHVDPRFLQAPRLPALVAAPDPGVKPMTRRERAKSSAKAQNTEKTHYANNNEKRLAAHIPGAIRLPDHEPFDVVLPRDLVEVKTIFPGANKKITMHPSSLRLKHEELAAAPPGTRAHTVMFDVEQNQWYYREGLGSFRTSAMTPMSLDEIATIIGRGT